MLESIVAHLHTYHCVVLSDGSGLWHCLLVRTREQRGRQSRSRHSFWSLILQLFTATMSVDMSKNFHQRRLEFYYSFYTHEVLKFQRRNPKHSTFKHLFPSHSNSSNFCFRTDHNTHVSDFCLKPCFSILEGCPRF